jgi:hypothetical protein
LEGPAYPGLPYKGFVRNSCVPATPAIPHAEASDSTEETRNLVPLTQRAHSSKELTIVADAMGLSLTLGALNYSSTPFGNAIEVRRDRPHAVTFRTTAVRNECT